jgi:uncharacterized CHY-type Zn-finger protein
MSAIALRRQKDCNTTMNEPTIICPNCQHELKLTESIAAPHIQKSQRQFEQRLAQKDKEILKRKDS